MVPKEEFLSVDDQIIPTKGRHQLKQYNQKKLHKWGYKNLVLSGSSEFSYDFDIFAGEQSNTFPDGAPDLGVSGNVVTRLTSAVPRNKNHKIFFDNWFNSPMLQVHLSKIGLLSLGTARPGRVTDCIMPSEKEIKAKGRGSMIEKTAIIDEVEVSCVVWFDNKLVTMLSTFVGSCPETTKERYSRKDKEYITIHCPKAIDIYNKYMGGVDLLDSHVRFVQN